MRINSDRLWNRIHELGRIGSTDTGGVTRFAFSKEDKKATNLVINWMHEAGLLVWRDSVGNVFGRRKGKVQKPVILTGSHLDTVRDGGKFDGAAGVLASLEVLQTLEDNSIETEYPVEMAIFVNEEGSRFAGGLMGSMAVTGQLPQSIIKNVDNKGVNLADALRLFGGKPDRLLEAKRESSEIKSFYELHIEQSLTLEKENKSVGIVLGIAGPYQMKVTIYGQSGHAGATDMKLRKDPMVAAAMIIQQVEKTVKETSNTTRGTVGFIKAYPGGHNIIPKEVEFTIDIRDINIESRDTVIKKIRQNVDKVCRERELYSEIIVTQDTLPVHVKKETLKKMIQCAKEQQLQFTTLPSGAAHDAMIMGNICDIGMIFVRSQKGLSHCPEEYTSKEDLAAGAQLLFSVIKNEANSNE